MKKRIFWTLCTFVFCLFLTSCDPDGTDDGGGGTDMKKVQQVDGTIGMLVNAETGEEERFFLVTAVETIEVPDGENYDPENLTTTNGEPGENQDECKDVDELAIKCEWDSLEQECKCLCLSSMPCENYRVIEFGGIIIDPIIHEDPRRLAVNPKFLGLINDRFGTSKVYSALREGK